VRLYTRTEKQKEVRKRPETWLLAVIVIAPLAIDLYVKITSTGCGTGIKLPTDLEVPSNEFKKGKAKK
jgi:hypothetical protein